MIDLSTLTLNEIPESVFALEQKTISLKEKNKMLTVGLVLGIIGSLVFWLAAREKYRPKIYPPAFIPKKK